ncbi:hypothetical protein AVEN_142381-1 [Araneus ventricosus]|uniref:Uncharacterized protein n=1 Tax=Araneus ventricosus TaxID=182803 RepID=A0A4Y2PH99_ARAVE|nr:hypothetical protein AVEN_142381-1 [Araneus ventricosus]
MNLSAACKSCWSQRSLSSKAYSKKSLRCSDQITGKDDCLCQKCTSRKTNLIILTTIANSCCKLRRKPYMCVKFLRIFQLPIVLLSLPELLAAALPLTIELNLNAHIVE